MEALLCIPMLDALQLKGGCGLGLADDPSRQGDSSERCSYCISCEDAVMTSPFPMWTPDCALEGVFPTDHWWLEPFSGCLRMRCFGQDRNTNPSQSWYPASSITLLAKCHDNGLGGLSLLQAIELGQTRRLQQRHNSDLLQILDTKSNLKTTKLEKGKHGTYAMLFPATKPQVIPATLGNLHGLPLLRV